MELVLASASPRRRELLTMIGLHFTVTPSDTDEDIPLLAPDEYVQKLALLKAQAVKKDLKNCCVIGADTIVLLNGEIIGKPKDQSDAVSILHRLNGNTHTVYTGLAVLTDDQTQLCYDKTLVTFTAMSNEEILSYVATGEPMDKAGAYGIQGPGGMFIEQIKGCYFTVIGMPLFKLYQMLKQAGIPVFSQGSV